MTQQHTHGVKVIPSVERINIEDTVGAAFAAQIADADGVQITSETQSTRSNP